MTQVGIKIKRSYLRTCVKIYRPILVSSIIVLLALSILAWIDKSPIYNSKSFEAHQAYSFLNGRLDIFSTKYFHDLSIFGGKMYAYWPPLPALLAAPIVYFTGPIKFPALYIYLFLASVSTGIAALIAANLIPLKSSKRELWILFSSLIYGLGTSNAIFGEKNSAWFNMQLIASLFILLGVLGGIRYWRSRGESKLLFCSTMLAMGVLSRHSLILMAFFPLIIPPRSDKDSVDLLSSRSIYLHLKMVVFPILLSLLIIAAFNYSRFGSVFTSGFESQNFSNSTLARYIEVFKSGEVFQQEIARSLYIRFIRPYPELISDSYDRYEGFGIFFQCPFLLLGLYGLIKREFVPLRDAFVASMIPTVIFLIFFFGTGYSQFGARYFHDLVPFMYAVVLLHCFCSKEDRYGRYWRGAFFFLGIVSILIQIWGILTYL